MVHVIGLTPKHVHLKIGGGVLGSANKIIIISYTVIQLLHAFERVCLYMVRSSGSSIRCFFIILGLEDELFKRQ